MAKSAQDLTRKEMKGPDQFQVAAGKVASWVAANEKRLAAAAGAVLVVLLAGVGIASFQRSREGKAAGLLYQALEAVEGEISSVPLPGATRPIFPSQEAKQRAVLAAAGEVRSQYPSSAAALTATLVAAEARFRLGEADAAQADFQRYLQDARSDDSLRFRALEGLARVQEGKGQIAEAVQTWERLGKEATFYGDRAALEMARLLAKSGKAEEARKLLAAFPEQFKESPLRPEAQERLAALGGK